MFLTIVFAVILAVCLMGFFDTIFDKWLAGDFSKEHRTIMRNYYRKCRERREASLTPKKDPRLPVGAFE